MLNEEAYVKKQIELKLQQSPKFYIYCSVCVKYLCTMTRPVRYITCWGCKNLPVKYYNQASNPPPKPT